MAEITFRPVALADLPLLAGWMAADHWRQWWGEPEEELTDIRAMIEGRDTTRPYLFFDAGLPVGYIQVWKVADNLFEPWLTEAPWMALVAPETVGVDLSIGPPEALGRGIGSRALAAFVAMLRAEGHRRIVIDPDPANARAVRAYEKAGFRVMPELVGRSGDSLIMLHQEVTP